MDKWLSMWFKINGKLLKLFAKSNGQNDAYAKSCSVFGAGP